MSTCIGVPESLSVGKHNCVQSGALFFTTQFSFPQHITKLHLLYSSVQFFLCKASRGRSSIPYMCLFNLIPRIYPQPVCLLVQKFVGALRFTMWSFSLIRMYGGEAEGGPGTAAVS